MITARDQGLELAADPSRVVARLFLPGESVGPSISRVDLIADRVNALPLETATHLAANILADFTPRHVDFRRTLAENATAAMATIGGHAAVDDAHGVVFGASVTSEYAVEGAALCNPSPVIHPDQTGLAAGQLRVAVSLRGIGEGHVSSLGFTSAVVGPGETWTFEPRDAPLASATVTRGGGAWSSYHSDFATTTTLSQRVIQPVVDEERNGVEDARFVRFTHDDGTTEYRATYTAYDGEKVTPRLLVSRDLANFASHNLIGPASTNKGVALFPRRVHGDLLAIVRSDGETNSLARSDDGVEWHGERAIRRPQQPWELVLSGNCGSPLETERGWLVLTHGVGPMRVYSMSAILLDLDDPSVLIAALDHPFLTSTGAKQNGYVPNVVYSCGGLIHDSVLWMPHGVGDNRIRVAALGVDELIDAMTRV